MTHSTLRAVILVALAGAAPLATSRGQRARPSTEAALHLASVFGDGMVLQRETPIPVWGSARPRARVDVALDAAEAHAVAGADGRWKLSLPAMRAGGPHTLTASSRGQRVVLRDLLIGDVWLASGQSNMELEVAQAANAAAEIRGAHDSLIRQLKVPIAWGWSPSDDLPRGRWAPADSAHVGRFTAVGYYFARALRQSLPVPVGLVNSSWGGSAIESWLSAAASGLSPEAIEALRLGEERRSDSLRARWQAMGAPTLSDAGMANDRPLWADPSLPDSAWATIPVPAYWEGNGYADLDGVAWYRREVDLTAAEVAASPTLVIAAVDDDDVTWMNGVEVGRTTGYNVARRYPLPASALRVGRNVLAIRVADGGGGGGINGEPALVFAGGTTRSLAGRWKFRVGRAVVASDGQRINKIPTVAYNRMIAPLLPFPIKGVIWYQGESNANNPAQARAYRESFITLIRSWRSAFPAANGPIPFLWVQLPNYGSRDSTPPDAPGWALQRESMEGALALPNTGRAITIDVGEDANLHPPNKQEVGARLARVALAVAYHRPVLASGPRYRGMRLRGDTVIVDFDDAGGGLVSRATDGRSVGSFAVAGADRKFSWATARIVGDHVELWSDRVHAPVAVRYAWANAPRGPLLYNREGLPAAPFRTDRW